MTFLREAPASLAIVEVLRVYTPEAIILAAWMLDLQMDTSRKSQVYWLPKRTCVRQTIGLDSFYGADLQLAHRLALIRSPINQRKTINEALSLELYADKAQDVIKQLNLRDIKLPQRV